MIAEVLGREDVGNHITALTLHTPDGFTAYPGQFVLVRVDLGDEEVGRHYTISSPFVTDSFELAVETIDTGEVSSWLANREIGEKLSIEGPFGTSFYDGDGNVIVVASGPGIGAGLAVAERAVANGNEATVLYVTPDVAFESRLSALSGAGACVFIGSSVALGTSFGPEQFDQGFVFGFREFIDDVRAELCEFGSDPDVWSYENYGYRTV